jgi:DNA repair photolyase
MKKQAKVERRDTYQSPRWSNEFLDCSMPMTFDQYNLCSYRCQYCFSFYQRIHMKDYAKNNIKWVDVDKVKKIFLEPDSSEFGEYVKARIPMQWGGLSEPFDLVEPHFGIGLELMKFFREIDYPVSFSTKSTWFVKDKRYKDVIKGAKNFHFKWSIITLDEKKAKIVEQGVPSPKERLEALGEVAKWGTSGVNLRLRPFMIGISDPTHLDLIREAHKYGAQALSTEFFCLETRADLRVRKRYTTLSKACGFDIWQFYRKNSTGAGYLRLNYEIKRRFVEEMQSLCEKLGMGFFVSDAHHKEKCVLANGCRWGSCCGVPNDKYFSNYAKTQFTEAITIAKEKGEVRFSDITKFGHKYLEKVMWKDAQGLNQGNSGARLKNWNRSLFDMMRYIWNNPKRGSSPWKYFGGMMIPTGLDEEGNVIYKFNQSKYDNRTK